MLIAYTEQVEKADVCHWKEKGVTQDATLAAKSYAKPWGCIRREAAAMLHPCVSLLHCQSENHGAVQY